jgi:hypothetical protein
MRSIATAIEAYTVDYNKPVPDSEDWQSMGRHGPWDCLLWPLTTPVAYMTSMPPDPFARRSQFEETERPFYSLYVTRTGWGKDIPGTRHDPTDPAAWFYGPRSNYRWMLDSAGPDLWWEAQRSAYPQERHWAGDVIYYDSTNGSKSQGDIYYYGPGGGINPRPVTCR